MCELLLVVSANLLVRETLLLKTIVEKDAGAGPGLPVDESHIGPKQILDSSDALGVAGPNEKALLTHGYLHQAQGYAFEIPFDIGKVVFTRPGVQKM
jgi:hypothetical protein